MPTVYYKPENGRWVIRDKQSEEVYYNLYHVAPPRRILSTEGKKRWRQDENHNRGSGKKNRT